MEEVWKSRHCDRSYKEYNKIQFAANKQYAGVEGQSRNSLEKWNADNMQQMMLKKSGETDVMCHVQ